MPEIQLKKRFKYAGDVFAALMKKGWSCTEAADFVNSFRDADAVPVVRCKDCKHYYYRNKTRLAQSARYESKTKCCCRSAAIFTKPDDFCSQGERKEE